MDRGPLVALFCHYLLFPVPDPKTWGLYRVETKIEIAWPACYVRVLEYVFREDKTWLEYIILPIRTEPMPTGHIWFSGWDRRSSCPPWWIPPVECMFVPDFGRGVHTVGFDPSVGRVETYLQFGSLRLFPRLLRYRDVIIVYMIVYIPNSVIIIVIILINRIVIF